MFMLKIAWNLFKKSSKNVVWAFDGVTMYEKVWNAQFLLETDRYAW